MSEVSDNQVAKPLPNLRGRVLSVVLSSVVGPALVGALFGIFMIIGTLVTEPEKFEFKDLALILILGSAGPITSTPVALGVGGIGLFLSRKNPVISLKAVLIMGMISVALVSLLVSGVGESWKNFPPMMLFLALPSLISAAICWRITRRWHSQPPPPNAPLQP